jgi:hypothetical protein
MEGKVSDELESIWKNLSWPILMYYPNIFLEGLRKITKILSRDRRSPGRDLNPGPPEYVCRNTSIISKQFCFSFVYFKNDMDSGRAGEISPNKLTVLEDVGRVTLKILVGIVSTYFQYKI